MTSPTMPQQLVSQVVQEAKKAKLKVKKDQKKKKVSPFAYFVINSYEFIVKWGFKKLSMG